MNKIILKNKMYLKISKFAKKITNNPKNENKHAQKILML